MGGTRFLSFVSAKLQKQSLEISQAYTLHIFAPHQIKEKSNNLFFNIIFQFGATFKQLSF